MQNLLPQIATGDPSAVEAFLKRHSGMVWGLARRFCRNAEDAEDATQEIFVDVWRSAARYDAGAGSEVTFLMTIARRRLIDRARRLGRRISADLLEDAGTIPSPPTSDKVELHDEVARAQDALKKLRPEQKEVLDLALGQGRTHQEIAATIGIPLGTVKSHARRGLIKLREMLGVNQDGSSENDTNSINSNGSGSNGSSSTSSGSASSGSASSGSASSSSNSRAASKESGSLTNQPASGRKTPKQPKRGGGSTR